MRRALFFLLLAPLCCLCQIFPRIQAPTPTPAATPSATSVPSPTVTATVTTTSVTATAVPSPTPTISTQLSVHRSVFEELWTIVNEEYLYPDFNGLDWDAIHEEYRQRVETGLSDDEFYLAMDEMIARLGDDHSHFLSPAEVAESDAEYAGEHDYVGIGVLAAPVPERQRGVILVVFPNSPAEAAGLQAHDSILAVDGQPILDETGALRDIVCGPEGTTITLTIQTPGQEPRPVAVTRRRITGKMPVPHTVLVTPDGRRVGYVLLVTFFDSTVADQLGDALREMSADAPLDGLIIDNRPNEGGADTMMIGVLSYFTTGRMGYFISRKQERPLTISEGRDVGGSQQNPLVVLVGPDTVSYGEVFAGILKDLGRAYLIGETTEGNVETLWGYDFEDGSRAWIAHETFRPRNHPGQDWEQTGIVPDLTIPVNWDEVTLETDPAVAEGLAYLDGLK